ncbi:hypothetical protein [Lacticaseibacillus saniviri]
MIMKKSGIAALVVLGIAVVGMGAWWMTDQHTYSSIVDTAKDVKKWEADPRPLQSDAAAKKQVTQIKQSSKAASSLVEAHKMVVIPGLRGAWSINYKTKKVAFGNDWVPQGVTQSKTHYYISMYDGRHKLNSIVTQIDRKTGKYLKTLILNSKAHVGGITYDQKRQRLMWSDDTGKGAGAGFAYVDKPVIDAYQASESKQPIASKRIPWELGSRTSAITLYDNQLIVVKYGQKASQHSIVAVPLDKNGLPKPVTLEQMLTLIQKIPQAQLKKDPLNAALKAMIDKKMINSYAPGYPRLQGVAVTPNGLTLLSQSNGEKPGKILLRIPEGGNWSNLKFTKPEAGATVINVPNSVEEVGMSADASQIAMVFESGARQYRETGSMFHRPKYMDRLLILSVES